MALPLSIHRLVSTVIDERERLEHRVAGAQFSGGLIVAAVARARRVAFQTEPLLRESELESEGGFIWARKSPERRVAFADVARGLSEPLLRQVAKLNQEFTSALDPQSGHGKAYWPYVFGTHIVTVGVNLKTAQLKISEYVAAHDVGKVINPITIVIAGHG